MNKQELITEIRNRKRQFTQSQLVELSLSIIMQLKKNPHLRKTQTIHVYLLHLVKNSIEEWFVLFLDGDFFLVA